MELVAGIEPRAGKSFGSRTSLAEETEWFVPKLGVVEFGGVGSTSWWIAVAVATVGDAGAEGVVAAVSAVGRRDQFGMDSQSFAAISGCNLVSVGVRYFAPDG